MSATIALSTDLETCLAIRRVVFIDEQNVSEADELDGRDAAALHVLATVDGAAVGTARMLVDGSKAKIGRVAVLKSHRGTGLGAALIQKLVAVAGEADGVSRVILGAQTHALGFYERLGFTAFGPIYDDAGIDHRDMELSV